MNIEYDGSVGEAPQHIDIVLLQEVLENALRRSNVVLQRIHCSMGSSTGENYCSQIYRVRMHYEERQQSGSAQGSTPNKTVDIIIKSMPETNASEFLLDLQAYSKERVLYADVLPLMELLLKGNRKFGPRLYFSQKHPVRTLIFEDMCAKGYQLASREQGLDDAQCDIVMRKLGEFHAVSMVLGEQDPALMQSFSEGMLAKEGLEREKSTLMHFFRSNADALIDEISQWPGYEQITQKLQRYFADLKHNLCRSQAPQEHELKVLNHGDLWVNNMLFRYDNESHRLDDVVFIDFQMGVWSSPGIDLNYFLNTSLSLETLQQRREQLIAIYYKSLADSLRRLNFANVPSYECIQEEVRQRESYGFFANFAVYPTISMDKADSSDNTLDNILKDDFVRNKTKKMFASKRVQKTLRYTLQRFDALNIWD